MIVYREAFYAFRKNRDIQRHGAWWRWFRASCEFDHVAAFYYDTMFERWLLIEWSELGLFFGIITEDELDRYIVLIDCLGGKILRYKAMENDDWYIDPPFGWSYCVAGAKQLANIKSWALTPDQLFRALSRRGARAVFQLGDIPDGDHNEFHNAESSRHTRS